MSLSEEQHLLLQDILSVAKELGHVPSRDEYDFKGKYSKHKIAKLFGSWTTLLQSQGLKEGTEKRKEKESSFQVPLPKILFFDIETAPMLSYHFNLYDENIGINQIVEDWHVMSWCAMWLDSETIMYEDNRDHNKEDRLTIGKLWVLLDQADIVITQNGKKFDEKKLNARFAFHKMNPYSSFLHYDTLQMAKKHFKFTSNSLEYLTKSLCENKKQKSKKYIGHDLWKECLLGNLDAWEEMRLYNVMDVVSLKELYLTLRRWNGTVSSLFVTDLCECGGDLEKLDRYAYTSGGAFCKFKCTKCGKEYRDKHNLMSPAQRKELKITIKR